MDSPLRRNAEVAPAEPSGSWTRRGNPAGIWSEMRRRHTRTPPAASIGSPRSPRTGPASSSTNPEDSGGLTAGARAAVLRHSVETGAVVKVQGTVTAVDQAGAKSAVTGPWANQEDLLKDVSAAEISRLLGVSRNTVYRYWGRAGRFGQAMTSQTNPHG